MKNALIAVLLFTGNLTAKDDSLSSHFDAAIKTTAEAAGHLGYEYAELVQLFEKNPTGAREACRLLPKLDRIRQDAGYRFPSIESKAEVKIMRDACRREQ